MYFHPLSLLTLVTPFITAVVATPHALAAGSTEHQLQRRDGPPAPCNNYPDHADPSYLGYSGQIHAFGFPSFIQSPSQGQVTLGRIEDTIRRALGAVPVDPPANTGTCGSSGLPYYQGTVYIGSIQIFLTWDGLNAHFCSVLTPSNDAALFFPPSVSG